MIFSRCAYDGCSSSIVFLLVEPLDLGWFSALCPCHVSLACSLLLHGLTPEQARQMTLLGMAPLETPLLAGMEGG